MLERSSNFDSISAAALQIFSIKPYFLIQDWPWIYFLLYLRQWLWSL